MPDPAIQAPVPDGNAHDGEAIRRVAQVVLRLVESLEAAATALREELALVAGDSQPPSVAPRRPLSLARARNRWAAFPEWVSDRERAVLEVLTWGPAGGVGASAIAERIAIGRANAYPLLRNMEIAGLVTSIEGARPRRWVLSASALVVKDAVGIRSTLIDEGETILLDDLVAGIPDGARVYSDTQLMGLLADTPWAGRVVGAPAELGDTVVPGEEIGRRVSDRIGGGILRAMDATTRTRPDLLDLVTFAARPSIVQADFGGSIPAPEAYLEQHPSAARAALDWVRVVADEVLSPGARFILASTPGEEIDVAWARINGFRRDAAGLIGWLLGPPSQVDAMSADVAKVAAVLGSAGFQVDRATSGRILDPEAVAAVRDRLGGTPNAMPAGQAPGADVAG